MYNEFNKNIINSHDHKKQLCEFFFLRLSDQLSELKGYTRHIN